MREIKFRAWDKERLEWEYLPESGNIELGQTEGETFFLEFDYERFIIEQFTGLYDKNGSGIYEGDVVKYDAIRGKTCQITWDIELSRFIIMTKCKGDYAGLTTYNKSELEIIGNIHENPELLEKTT